MDEKEKEMEELKIECLNFCQKHSLYQKGTYPVFGEGSLEARIMFIGEAPGYYESVSGRPFYGAAGKVLDELLNSIEIKRKEVYITNIVKLRPPNNREPKPEEIRDFAPYLERQIEIIKPGVICTLGNYSTGFIFEKYELQNQIQGISKIRGKIFKVESLSQNIKIIPLYHPAVAVYNPKMKEILKKDFKILEKLK